VTVKELGVIELRYGRLDAAAELFAQAQALCREAANVSGEAEVISQQGLTETLAGRPEEGAVLYKRAVSMNREVEDLDGEGWALARAVQTELSVGRAQSAADLAEQALQITNILGADSLRAYALNMLGVALTVGGHPDRAPARHLAALDLAESMGAEHERANAHHGLAQAHAALGHDQTALDHARAAYAWYAQAGVPEAAQIWARFPALARPDPAGRRPGGEGTCRMALA
jgi:tetratricopeptide (TPR) repeat protein